MAYFVLTLALLATRLPFIAKYLFNWDSGQFALALDVFNISFHQPHPPGYFLYVVVAKIFNLVLNNPNLSYIIENIIFFILAVFVFLKLSRLVFKNNQIAWVASVVLIFNPVVWFYSNIAAVYMVDLFFSLFFVLLAWQITFENTKNIKRILMFSFVLGLSVGFRQTLLIFFAPLWLLALIFYYLKIKNKKDFLKIFSKAIVILIIGILIWLIPVASLSGGIENYLSLIKEQFGTAGRATSLFQQADRAELASQVKKFLKSILLIINFSIIFLFFGITKIFKIKRINFKNTERNKKILIFIAWLAPSCFVYCLMHFAQVGYLFTIAGAFFLLIAWGLYYILEKIRLNWIKIILMTVFILSQCFIFFYGWDQIKPTKSKTLENIYSKVIDYRISPHQLDFQAIKKNDQKIEGIINTTKLFDPQKTVLITEFGSPYVNPYENWADNFRIVSYYLPEYEIYELFWGEEKKYFKTQHHSLSQLTHSEKIILAEGVKQIIFVNNTEKNLLKNKDKLLKNSNLTILKTKNGDTFEYLDYQFIVK